MKKKLRNSATELKENQQFMRQMIPAQIPRRKFDNSRTEHSRLKSLSYKYHNYPEYDTPLLIIEMNL